MRVFVTGASGWIGSAVVPELLAAGHEVVGLARSDASAARITDLGATPHRGSLDDVGSLRAGAEPADAVVHLGFNHDFTDVASAWRTERAAVEAFLDVLAGSGRALVVAAGTGNVAPGRVVTEKDRVPTAEPEPRGGGENLVLAAEARDVRGISVRFPPTVHGDGDHGFVAALVRAARERGESVYAGDGSGRWPAVHRLDAGRAVALALASAPAGTVVHAVAEEGVPTRGIAEAIGAGLGVPTTSVTADEAAARLGFIGRFFALDVPASSASTRELLGWEPAGPTLLDDLRAGVYFR